MDIDAGANGVGNRILQNAIFGNGDQGIDLASDGITPNDSGDADAGPNRLQNNPVLRAPVRIGNNRFRVTGTLSSTPGSRFHIEFFASSRSDDGEVFLGSLTVATDGHDNSRAFRFDYKAVTGRPYLTATATNLATGDTPELSAAVQQPLIPALFETRIFGRSKLVVPRL